MAFETYFLSDGVSGHERLRLLNALYDAETLRGLASAGLRPGARVLEIGTGPGVLTRALAEAVGPTGSVLTVDQSDEQTTALRDGGQPANVEARHLPLSRLDELGETYDLVFARWILLHLTDPRRGVRALAERVRPGGVLAIEDCVTASAFCHPSTPAFDRFVEGWLGVARQEGLTADAGDHLVTWIAEAGIPITHLSHHQPLLVDPAHRRLPAMSLEESRSIHAADGIFDDATLDTTIDELTTLCDSDHAMGFVRNTLVAGTRAA